MKLKDQYKNALADILCGDEIGRIIRATEDPKLRGKIADFANAIKTCCMGKRENISGLPLILLMNDMPGELMWKSIFLQMIENEIRHAGMEEQYHE